MEKGEALLEIAMAAWKSARKGTNADFLNHRVVKLDRMLLVMPRLSEWPLNHQRKSGGVLVVAYPRPEHVEAFKRAASSVAPGGPAEQFPGSIGSLELEVWSRNHPLELRVAQSHFKSGNDHYLYKGQEPLPRSLATRYHGWRKRALRHVVELAHSRGRDFRSWTAVLYRSKSSAKLSALHQELIEIAGQLGTKLVKKRRTFEIKLPKR